jgi:Inward rectifier potassium channel C-terminal domain/Ion channel
MFSIKKISEISQTDNATGFGTNRSWYGGRLVQKNGLANIEKRGLNFLEKFSWYHTFLLLPRWKFFLVLVSTYILINLFFAILYFLIGSENLQGIIGTSFFDRFTECFFFSTQTFTTVGYGRISPVGFLASSLATFESFLGLLNFALATGLFYGRFSRPQAFLKFSHNGIIAPYKGGIAFMFRMVPFKNNYLSNAEVKLTLAMAVEENGKKINKFFPLELELNKVNALNLSWTIVHPIDEKSPLFGMSIADLFTSNAEIMVFVEAFDDLFSNTVLARTSYIGAEIIRGAKFGPMYHQSGTGDKTVLELDKLNELIPADIGDAFPEK